MRFDFLTDLSGYVLVAVLNATWPALFWMLFSRNVLFSNVVDYINSQLIEGPSGLFLRTTSNE